MRPHIRGALTAISALAITYSYAGPELHAQVGNSHHQVIPGYGASHRQSVDFVPSATLAGGEAWQAPFDVTIGLVPSGMPVPYDANKGAFRFVCGGQGKLRRDDPVVYPGKPGASHLHQPWGNADFTAFTTPQSLRESALTDCNDTPFSLNRSSYWMPALVNDQGQAIQPDAVVVYYKQWASDSPPCTPGSKIFVGTCVTIPNQIRFIFGWDMFRPNAKVEGAGWYCTGGPPGRQFADLAGMFAAGCKLGGTLTAVTLGPNCWDGKHLDTPDHRSHTAYADHGSRGSPRCPASHPYVIPQEENKAQWTVTADMVASDGRPRIGLSSDPMKPDAKPGETLHADYMEAWDERAKAMWFEGCIQKRLSCNDGNLGNGFKLIGAGKPPYGWVNPTARQTAF